MVDYETGISIHKYVYTGRRHMGLSLDRSDYSRIKIFNSVLELK